ncbi:hypothetical protein KBA63_02825 [Candidatus Woesebacteria bacterium]|jgi:hypothetical protein|nr:hypothetical protein [Candidatus Woesebacteria bacterium]MBP9687704.1 hypothetical protein [Candidatus Woesebacteria bacterium]
MFLIPQSESLIGKLVSLLTLTIPEIKEDVRSVPEGMADAGPGEALYIDLKNGESICIAPDPNGTGYILCLVSRETAGARYRYQDSPQERFTKLDDLKLKVKEFFR